MGLKNKTLWEFQVKSDSDLTSDFAAYHRSTASKLHVISNNQQSKMCNSKFPYKCLCALRHI